MYAVKTNPATRKRAPSKRSIETGRKVLDAAEKMFAMNGFDGTSIRDIAAEAGVTTALVNFHGGAKEHLFETVVARRAEELATLRLARLRALEEAGQADIRPILQAFVGPLLERAAGPDPQWLAYARLVAIVSADHRWASLTQQFFDPTAQRFAQAIALSLPDLPPREVATGFVFTVSAMLSLCTSQWRVEALAGPGQQTGPNTAMQENLVNFCEAGLRALSPRG